MINLKRDQESLYVIKSDTDASNVINECYCHLELEKCAFSYLFVNRKIIPTDMMRNKIL